jgi:protein gp37
MKWVFERYFNSVFKNLWVGVSAENQKRADERIPILLEIPAAVRFVSVEPMLEPIKMRHAWIRQPDNSIDYHQRIGYKNPKPARGLPLDWVICGGETGLGAREMKVEWARDLRDQCKSAGVPFFFKNMSKKAPIPYDLFIREFPND